MVIIGNAYDNGFSDGWDKRQHEINRLRTELATAKDESLTFRCQINALEQLGIAAEEAWKAAANRDTEEIARLKKEIAKLKNGEWIK